MPGIPDPETFFLKTSLYTAFEIGIQGFIDVMRVQFFQGTIDAYCASCGRESVFQSAAEPLSLPQKHGPAVTFSVDDLVRNQHQAVAWPYGSLPQGTVPTLRTLSEMKPLALADRVFHVRFDCIRDNKQPLYFFFQVREGSIQKVGQSPSIADLHTGGVKKYRKILGDEKYREFTKAIGLHAHGIGIGAFVYLRRIFEDLIGSTRKEAEKAQGWDNEAYASGRMNEKIQLLHGRLPSFLVENRSIYSILSLGLHELGERVCLEIFEPLRVGIELILDEKLEQQERAAKIAHTKQSLSKIKEDLDKGRR